MKLSIDSSRIPVLLFRITISGVILFGIIYLWRINASRGYLKTLNQTMIHDAAFVEKYHDTYEAPELRDLMHEKAYRQALAELSGRDSIQLFISLSDSVIGLTIRGVEIFHSRLLMVQIDPDLQNLSNRAYYYYYSHPRSVSILAASLVKEPVVIRKAPKSPEEAAQRLETAYLPEAQLADPAFLGLAVDSLMQIVLFQDSVDQKSEKTALRKFENGLRRSSRKQQISWNGSRMPGRIPVVKLVVSPADLRAIYRALPERVWVAFRD